MNGLTFHTSANLGHRQNCEWIDDDVRILGVIESMLEGVPYDDEE